MRKFLVIACSIAIALMTGTALADLNYTQGLGTTIFDFICFTTKHCSAHVLIDSTGTEKATSGNPLVIDTAVSGNLITALSGAIGAGSNIIGFTSNDVCANAAKTNLAISTNSTSSVQLIALSGGTTIYVCSLSLIAAGATTVAITTGTGTACVTNNAAVIGTTTGSVSQSVSLAANGGLTLGSGAGTIAKGAAASELCIVLGSAQFVAGNLTYVQQ